MKTKRNLEKFAIVIILISLFSISAFSQNRSGRKEKREMMRERMEHKMRIPDLTEEQDESIKSLRLEFGKDVQSIKNELGELKARLHSLESDENPELNKIYSQIDIINEKRTAIEKKKAKLNQDIRKLLNDEQKLYFDTHRGKKGMFHHRPQRQNECLFKE